MDAWTFEDGASDRCETWSGLTRCVLVSAVGTRYAFKGASADYEPRAWHGTILDDKRDQAGTLYMRNRSYDPNTGRFTQEDPIGLAGGLNLYSYAGGDPANFSDPFGLCPGIPGTSILDLSDCPPGHFECMGSSYRPRRGL